MPKIIIFRQDLYSEIMSEPQLKVVALPAIDITSTGFTAKWLKNSVAREYIVDISTDPAFSSLAVSGVLVGDVTSQAFSGLQSGATYYYRVKATDGVKTGAWSNVISLSLPIPRPGFGLLYNRYAATDARNIAAEGWGVPDLDDINDYITYIASQTGASIYTTSDYFGTGKDRLSASALATAAIKDASLDYWDDITGVSNSMKFNARGSGYRTYKGSFSRIKEVFIMLSSSQSDGSAQSAIVLQVEGDGFNQTFSADEGATSGFSVRPFRPATAAEQLLPDGTACDNYVGNDLKEYPTVKIGTQVWLAANLAETKFRNKGIIYGALYNHFAVTDPRNIAAVGWDVCSRASINELIFIAGGGLVGGGKLKEKGLLYWASPNTGATNDFGFNLRAASQRGTLSFSALRTFNRLWLKDVHSSLLSYAWYVYTYSDSANITTYYMSRITGLSVRLNRPATAAEQLLSDGTACDNYTGNDLKVYRTVKIGNWIWLSENLCETRFRNGDSIQLTPTNDGWDYGSIDPVMCWDNNIEENSFSDIIPEAQDNTVWASLQSAGMCAYNNDWGKV